MIRRLESMDRYLILIKDICFSRDLRSKKFDSSLNISEYLKGTLLHEVLAPSASKFIEAIVIDTNDMIQCNESDVEELTEDVMLLLLAISSCKERYEVFRNKEKLADGLELQPGHNVLIRHPTSGEMSAKLRFKGEMRNRLGTYFGVELITGRGKGNTNGSIGKSKYFDCQEDCGMFVSLNRISSKNYEQRSHSATSLPRQPLSVSSRSMSGVAGSSTTSSNASSLNHPNISDPVIGVSQQELGRLGIYIGMEVYIFTEVRGKESQESGTIQFIGRLPNELPTADIYVGIDLVNPVGNGRGVFNKRHLFKTKPNHAALVPLSGVLPASTYDSTPPLQANGMENKILNESVRDATARKYHTDPTSRRPPLAETNRYSERLPTRRDYDLLINEKSNVSDIPSRLSYQRGPPDGGPLMDLDEDLPSQVDIYGTNSGGRSLLGHEKKYNTVPLSSFSEAHKQQVEKNALKQSRSLQDLNELPGLEEGSMVEVINGIEHIGDMGVVGPVYGVIQWIGELPRTTDLMAGIELEIPLPGYTDGILDGVRYFNCLPERAFFTKLKNCRRDPRFLIEDNQETSRQPAKRLSQSFGDFEASRLPGVIAPPTDLTNDMLGKGRGIQGHHNSCYLDSTLFSMFAYSYCLDSLLYRKRKSTDLPQYEDVQQVLTEDIVNPLRRRNFVRADRILRLREMLDELGSVTGLTNEEKDPEEFLQTLLIHVFKADPLFELRQGDSDHIQECYFYQIFMDKDDKMVLPSTQLLIEQSFLASDLKFRSVPVCLILQMPRFGKDYKMYNRVRPSLTLDVTDMLEKLPRSCTVCGGLAEFECKQCSIERSMQEHISSYCDQCAKICHQHPLRRKHKYRKIEVCEHYRAFIAREGERTIQKHTLELFAVVCIETSHYVSFAKCGSGKNAKWCFFDSMADRVGEQCGYNIPEVTLCENFEEWLAMDQSKLLEMDRKEMPDHMRRLLCDAYLCLYQSREEMCYS